MKYIAYVLLTVFGLLLSGCGSSAELASHNLSKAADEFKIYRRIVFYNGITDSYMLSVEGYCSILDEGNQLEVTCKLEDGTYAKNFLGLSDNVSYFAEQLVGSNVSNKHYKVLFNPLNFVPDVDLVE